MKFLKVSLLSFLVIIGGIYLFSFIVWLFYPSKQMNIYVLDKTVSDLSRIEHKSFFWILNNEKYKKSDGDFYSFRKDYHGFFPLRPLNQKNYDIKRISLDQVDSISSKIDAMYYIDTYGVYFNDWFKDAQMSNDYSPIDGGMKQTDYALLMAMRNKNKLIVAENNILGNPTSELISAKTQNLFGIEWKGWQGKYFSSLSEENEEINRWVNLYKQKNGAWPYNDAGILFINQFNEVFVLEIDKDLKNPLPVIVSSDKIAEKYELPTQIEYSGWFEIVTSSDTNQIVSTIQFIVTKSGDSILNFHSIPLINPIVITNTKNNLWYLAADFAHNSAFMPTSYLSNYGNWGKFIYIGNKKESFLWNFYRPLIKGIFNNYQESIKKNK